MNGWHQASVCLVAVVVAGLNLLPIELQRRIVDDAITPGNLELLFHLCIAYGVVLLIHQALKLAMRGYQFWLGESAILYTRRHLVDIYNPRESEESDESGSAVSIIGAEVDKLGKFVGEAPSQACANVAKLLGVVGYMLFVEPTIALVGFAFVIPQILIVPVMQRRLNVLVKERLKYLRELGDEVVSMESSGGGPGNVLRRIFDNHMAFYIWKFSMKAATNLVNALAPLSVLFWGGWMVIDGQATIGVVVAFLTGFERISGPIRELLVFYRVLAQARVQHNMIARWM